MNTTVLTREQLEERLAALHRASLDLVQDISLESLLTKIAELACQQANAQYAAVGVLDADEQLEAFIPVGMSPEEIAKMPHPPKGMGLIGALMVSQEPIRIPHISADPRSAGFPANHPAMESFLGVPIRQGDQLLGQIYLTNKIGATDFTSEDQLVIETLAAYAAAAITNARSYSQLLQRDQILTQHNNNQALLNELATTLATSTTLEQVLEKALAHVTDYLHLEAAEIFLRQEGSKTLKLALHRSEKIQNLWVKTSFVLGDGLVGRTAKESVPAVIDIQKDESQYIHKDAIDQQLKYVACFPLLGRRGVIGILCAANSHPQPPDELEMQFFNALSFWIGTSIENINLNQDQRRLAILEERERIGMDLHDGAIQSMYAVGLTLEHARLLLTEDTQAARQRIEQAILDLNSTIRDIRAYILDLRPRQLHDQRLMQGIQRLVAEFRANTSVEVTLEGPADGMEKVPEAMAIALFHICQEALANVAKHARARKVEITLWTSADRALLEIHDDGRGFAPDHIRQTIGHGLSNMYTRARNVGGDLEINAEPGQGTHILAWVPLE
jgi:signal transduction histidine kinase